MAAVLFQEVRPEKKSKLLIGWKVHRDTKPFSVIEHRFWLEKFRSRWTLQVITQGDDEFHSVNRLLMIPRPRTRPQVILQALANPSITSSSRQQCRSKHTVPKLMGKKDQVFAKYGVPGFLSAETYNDTWLKYQSHLCKRIDEQVRGTSYESLGVRELHEVLARRPADAALYNVTAMAHHNHFFWNTLSDSDQPTSPSKGFRLDVEEWFESLDHLRDEMLDSANSIFGNGFVWLMKDLSASRTLRILCTYNAGSPYPGAHMRQQSFDHSTNLDLASKLTNPQNRVGFFGDKSEYAARTRPGQLLALPILCLNVWEHQWLPDYGITGKEDYVRNWWDHIDWDEVLNIYNLIPETPEVLNRGAAGGQRGMFGAGAARGNSQMGSALGQITRRGLNEN